jgi:hypothetical protein
MRHHLTLNPAFRHGGYFQLVSREQRSAWPFVEVQDPSDPLELLSSHPDFSKTTVTMATTGEPMELLTSWWVQGGIVYAGQG